MTNVIKKHDIYCYNLFSLVNIVQISMKIQELIIKP